MQESLEKEPKKQRRRKFQAIMAGGLVLGVGAVVTLAAWNDSEFALGQFNSGTFNLESSTNGEQFTDHPTIEQAAELTFAADLLSPGDTVYAPFAVRLDSATTYGATINADNGLRIEQSSGNNVPNISFEVFQGASTCDAAGVNGETPIATGGSLSVGNLPLNNPITLTAGEGSAPGTPVNLCFAVTAGSQDVLLQGETAQATWRVEATSNDS